MAELPARFGRYILEERLGRGGMAEVFRARVAEKDFAKPVCIKRILPDLAAAEGFAEMLRDEAALGARLVHVNIVQAYDFGKVDGALFLAMELVEGTTLGNASRFVKTRNELFPLALALHIGVCMCRGLHHAHTATSNKKSLHIVHRDVSPDNVLLGEDGAIKIADFGVASATERLTRTKVGNVKGKPSYMSPEQILSLPLDHRTDQFATAIVLWETLSGRMLFAGPHELATLNSVLRSDVPDLGRPDVPSSVMRVLAKALAKDRGMRFADMAAFEQALAAELDRLNARAADIDVRPFVARVLESEREHSQPAARRPELDRTVEDSSAGRSSPSAPNSASSSSGSTNVFARRPPPLIAPRPRPLASIDESIESIAAEFEASGPSELPDTIAPDHAQERRGAGGAAGHAPYNAVRFEPTEAFSEDETERLPRRPSRAKREER